MPTSVICRTARVKSHRGFSLIELTVVLVLVSLATAMVLPNLSSAYTNLRNRSELDGMLISASSLSYEAFSSGEGISISQPGDVKRHLEVAEGWIIEVVEPLEITAIGVCLGGELRFTREAFSTSVYFQSPHCRVERGSF